MTYSDFIQLLKRTGYPVGHLVILKKDVLPPFIVTAADEDVSGADDMAVSVTDATYRAELYTLERNLEAEDKVEAALAGAGLTWSKTTMYIDAERIFLTVYETNLKFKRR